MCIIAKINIFTSIIGILFLASISDVPHPRHATSEKCEHIDGHMRKYNREMTVLETMEIIKRLRRNQISMYISGFNGGRTSKKVYQ